MISKKKKDFNLEDQTLIYLPNEIWNIITMIKNLTNWLLYFAPALKFHGEKNSDKNVLDGTKLDHMT